MFVNVEIYKYESSGIFNYDLMIVWKCKYMRLYR